MIAIEFMGLSNPKTNVQGVRMGIVIQRGRESGSKD